MSTRRDRPAGDEPVGDEPADAVAAEDERAPRTVRIAGGVTALEGAIAVITALVLIIRGLAGHEQTVANGYGTAGWFGIIGGGVLVGGVALYVGRRWGRAIALVAQILLLPVAYALLTDSHQPWFGAPLAVAAVAVLVLLFTPSSVQWLANDYAPDTPPEERGPADRRRGRG